MTAILDLPRIPPPAIRCPWVADHRRAEKGACGWTFVHLVTTSDQRQDKTSMATPAFEDIADTFAFLDDWEDRYRHVIELGKAMPPLDAAFKVPALKVDGCASQVWLRPVIVGQGPDARFDFEGESDAMIVRGLIAILHAMYAGLTVGQVLAVDAPAELKRLGLEEHLSSQRSNGLRAMVARVRKVAGEVAA
jgi:cysteine desulfuration protein SufE